MKIRDSKVYICNSEEQALEECDALDEWYLDKDEITSTESCDRDTFVIDEPGYFVL